MLVENFAPGVLDRMGFAWERIQELNPRMIMASVKGFGPGPFEDCKVYENVAQAMAAPPRPPASTTGRRWSPARRSATRDRDPLALGILAALYQRNAHRARAAGRRRCRTAC